MFTYVFRIFKKDRRPAYYSNFDLDEEELEYGLLPDTDVSKYTFVIIRD